MKLLFVHLLHHKQGEEQEENRVIWKCDSKKVVRGLYSLSENNLYNPFPFKDCSEFVVSYKTEFLHLGDLLG